MYYRIIERLPYKLLSQILANLNQEDIINLPCSIACKGLSERQLSTIFNVIDIWLDEKSLRTFIRATKHPLVISRVKSLRFHGDELSRVGSRTFQGHFTNDYNVDAYGLDPATRQIASAGPPSSSREVVICRSGNAVERYRRYRELYQAQENMRLQNKTIALLAKGLRRLHNPLSFIIDNHYGFSSQARLKTLLGEAWLPVYKARALNQNRLYLCELLVTISKRFRIASYKLTVENTAPPGFMLPNKGLRYIPGIDLDERILDRDPGFPDLRKFSLRGSPNPALSVFERYGFWYTAYHTSCKVLHSSLQFCLQSCKNLEHLEVSLMDKPRRKKGYKEMVYLPLLGVIDMTRNRPPLRTLSLGNCKILESELVRFVLSVSETLKIFRITNLYLTKGSRQTLFESLGSELTLENATINGLFQKYDYDNDTTPDPFGRFISPEDLPFPYTLDQRLALDWFWGRCAANPYTNDDRLTVPRNIGRYRERNRPWIDYRIDNQARYSPSNIFTKIGVTISDMGFPCRSWSQ